jgi:hypothetical protein
MRKLNAVAAWNLWHILGLPASDHARNPVRCVGLPIKMAEPVCKRWRKIVTTG